ncbi:MAG TPA: hypothetical protein VHZ07_03430 [Bryobacteraceae bacterium]|nr:hypothetical protein [Bryobacteraceae bacterium]
MTSLATKEQILKNAGYVYSFDRELYLNRKSKKAFSIEFIEDHSAEEIEGHIRQNIPETDEWTFFFNKPPSTVVKRELANVLG